MNKREQETQSDPFAGVNGTLDSYIDCPGCGGLDHAHMTYDRASDKIIIACSSCGYEEAS